MNQLNITVLVENTASGRDVCGEHGLSFWIETNSHRILFDTGQTAEVLLKNAKKLHCDLTKVDTLVLSHGHYDHTGGLERILELVEKPILYLHKDALLRRFSQHPDGHVQDVGIPASLDEARLSRLATLVWTDKPTTLFPGIHTTGPIPRVTEYEDTGGRFFLDETCRQVDKITDDQAIYISTKEGTVVLLGCAHAGVVNTLNYVQQLTNNQPVYAVIGGMHLVKASPKRIDQTVEALRQFDVKYLVPAHCTGAASVARLWSEFTPQWQPCHVGARFQFHL